MAEQFPSRRARGRLPWLLLAGFCAIFGLVERGIESAGRRADRMNDRRHRLASEIVSDYADKDARDCLALYGLGARPVDVRLGGRLRPGDRIIVDAASLGRRYAGWHVEIRNSSNTPLMFLEFRAIPPPRRTGFLERVGAPEVRYNANQFRKFLLILCATAWGTMLGMVPFAGVYRRSISKLMIGVAFVALVACVVDPEITSWRPVDLPVHLKWIGSAALGGLVIAVAGLAVPVRKPGRRANRCKRCGYNLTGNVSGACPECGTPTPAEVRRRHDAELEPLVDAIRRTAAECGTE